MAGKLPGSAIQSNTISITQIQTTAVTNIIAQAGPRVSSLIYPGNDTAGNTVGGQTVYINGSGFETNNAIYINGNAVPSKSFISASNLSFTTPALSAGIYPVYVINTDSGATAIFVPGYISSAEPTWVSSSAIDAEETWSIALSATGDAPVTYALAAGSSLPSGISLAANGLISGTMSSPPVNNTQYTFTVVASDAQNQDASRQFTVSVTTGEGLLCANNVLLIHADGTNNQNNHTFLDSSNNNFTITRVGNATQGTFSPFSQTGWSGYFDGTGDYLTVPAGSAFAYGTGDFTVEGWFYATAEPVAYGSTLFAQSVSGTNYFLCGVGSDALSPTKVVRFQFATSGGGTSIVSSTTYNLNSWNHFAIVRNSGSVTVYLNGVGGSSGSCTQNFSDTSYVPTIGRYSHSDTNNFTGFISNLRVIKGTALYTSNFTPSTSALTAVSGTSLLTCQSNRFRDNSSNNFTITRNGDVSIQAFSPFAPTAAYSTANVGGSVYVDGTGDYLIVGASNLTASSTGKTPLAVGAGDFTIEGWFNTSNVSSSAASIFKHYASPGTNDILEIRLVTNTVTVRYRVSGGVEAALTSGTITAEQWYHVAFVRNSGVVKGYLNGTEFGSANFTGNLVATTTTTTIGCDQAGTSNFIGDISNFRFVKGTAVYTSAFTPPTAPPTNIANTSLLCNFTNAGIFDQTAKTVIETVGDAKISTAQYKYGTGSVVFDGNGDYCRIPYNSLLQLSGDFTIECWVYPISKASNFPTIINNYSTYTTNGGFSIFAGHNSGTTTKYQVAFNGAFPVIQSSNNIAYNAWSHLAFTRSGSTLRLFVNGIVEGTNTSTAIVNGTQNFYWIGAAGDELANSYFNGYIDDLRITRGSARYTTNFTPPTSAFKDK